MKKYISILFVILTFIVLLSCNSKTEKSEQEKTEAEAQVVKNENAEAVSTKRAKLAKELAEKAEERRQAIEAKAKLSTSYQDASGKVVYYKAEVDPSYIGGKDELTKYLRDNLKYPQEAKDNHVEGHVFVDFIIDASGRVREVVATDLIGEDVDLSLKEEAVRVVAAMPGWKAGMQQGKPVDVSFSIPITFELEN
jgi:TonB family protein